MRRAIAADIAIVLFMMNVVSAQTGAPVDTGERPLSITRVGLDRKVINLAEGEKVTLSFEISKKADVKVTILDRLGRTVHNLDMTKAKAGRQSIIWDGRGDDTMLAPGNLFLYVIEAVGDSGERAVHNPAKDTGGMSTKPHEYSFDSNTGRIEYVLPSTCMIRIRAGLKDGMFARTLVDWEPRSAGRHVETWDGKDMTGKMNLLKHPDLNLDLLCYSLPANTIITTRGSSCPEAAQSAIDVKTARELTWATEGKYLHYRHDPRICHEPQLTVSFPATKNGSKGSPVVAGTTPVRVELAEKDVRDLVNKRFEVMFFIDGVFLFEMEEATSPLTYRWDTKGVSKGLHVVTVNVISYDDHIGVAGREVIVGE